MKLGISTDLFKKPISINDILDIKKAGISFLEISDYNEISFKVIDYMKKNSIGIYSMHDDYSNYDISDINESKRIKSIKDVKKRINKIKKMNGGLVVVHSGGVIIDKKEKRLRIENCINSLVEVVNYASLNNIKIAVENLHSEFLGVGIEEIDYIIKKVKNLSEHTNTIGLCLDTGHAFLNNTLIDCLDFFKKNIFIMHIHDNFGAKNKDKMGDNNDYHLPPGYGKIKWQIFFNKLNKINYKQPIVFEVVTEFLEIKDTKNILSQIKRFIEGEEFSSWNKDKK